MSSSNAAAVFIRRARFSSILFIRTRTREISIPSASARLHRQSAKGTRARAFDMSDRDALRVEFRRWSASRLDAFLRERGVALDDDASLETKIERACEEESRGDVEGERAPEEDEVDPLDAFMADLETTTTTRSRGRCS